MNEGKKQLSGLGDTYKTVLEMFSGNGVASAMPFLRFADRRARTRGVFPQGHMIYQSAVPYLPFPFHSFPVLSKDKVSQQALEVGTHFRIFTLPRLRRVG